MPLPALHGNWVDLIILVAAAMFISDGARRGFLRGIIELASLALSFTASLKFYSFFGKLLTANFSLPIGIANAAGFLIAGILAQTAFAYVASIVYSALPKTIRKSSLNQFLGAIPALLESLIYIAFFLTLLLSLPIRGDIKKDVLNSRIGSVLVAKTQIIEKQLNSIFAPAVNETLNFITIKTGSSESVNLHFTQKDVSVDEAAENTMLTLVNQERAKAGQKPLVLSSSLTSLARAYGKDMFARGYFSHYNPEGQSPFDRMTAVGITFTAAGENLALAPNVQIAHQGLINSPGHRANILSPDFGHIGIGAIDGGIYGEIFVQEFTD